MIRPLLRLLLSIPLSLLFVTGASAAVVTWDGGGADDNWGTCNNWSSNACPTSSDVATFDATSTDPVNIAATLTGATAPAGIDINTGYTGIITQNAGVSITVGASNFDQAAGTFTGGDSAITINGSFTLSSGTFTSTTGTLSVQGSWTHTAGGTFSHNNGTLRGTGAADAIYDFATSETFYNFVLDKTTNWQHSIAAGDTMIVNNAVTLTEGRLQGTGTIEVKGTVSIASTYDNGTANWKFSGTGDQTLTLYDADDNINGSITIDKASGSFLLGSALTLDCGGTLCNFTITQGTVNLSGFDLRSNDFTLTAGTFTTGGSTVDIDDDLTLTDGTFNASTGTTRLGGDFTHTSGTGTFSHNNGTFIFDTGQNSTINVSTSESFGSVTMDKGGFQQIITSGDTILVTGALALTNGRFGTGTIEAQGSVTVASTYDTDDSTLKFTGGNAQLFTLTGAEALFDGPITIDKSDGTVTLASALTMDNTKAFTMTNGTFDAGGYALSQNSTYSQSGGTFTGGAGAIDIDSTFTLSGGTFTATSGTMTLGAGFTHTAGGAFAHNNGTVEFDSGGNITYNVSTSETFYKLTMNKTGSIGTITSGDTFIILDTLTLTNGRFDTGTLEAQGSVTVGSGYDTGTAVLTFSGSATQTFTLTGAEALFDGDINVNKSGGAVNLASALTLNTSNQDLTIQEGTFDLSGFALSVTGGGTEKIIVETGGNLQLQGGETITADSGSYPQLDSGSTVTYDGESGPYTLKNYTYHHLTIAGGASSVFTLAANESLGGNLTLTTGILSQGGFTLAVTGTFSNSATLRRFQTESLTLTMDVDSGTVEYVGDGDGIAETVTVTDFGVTDYFNLKINDANATKDIFALGSATVLAGTLQVTSSEFQQGANALTAPSITVDGGTLTGGSSAVTVSGGVTISSGTFTGTTNTLTVSGAWTHTAGGTFTHNSGTVSFTGAASTIDVSTNETFSTLTINKTDGQTLTIGSGDTLIAAGTLTLTDGAFATGGIQAQGNVVVASTWDSGAGTLTFGGSGTQTFDLTGATAVLDNPVTINKAGGSVTLASAYTMDHANADFTLTLGTFSTGNYAMTTASGSDIAINGGIFNAGSSTMTIPGLLTVAGGTYNGNTSSGTISGAFLLSSGAYNGNTSTPTFSGGLTITDGVFTASSGTTTVAANFAHTAGTFTHNSGTVAFNTAGTTSTISGNTTFYNFSCTTANKPITFTAGSTQTISGLLTLTGASGNLIVLRSTVNDSAWNLTVNGTSSVDYVNVRDSNAGGGNAITHAVSASRSVSVANNTNWSFNAAPTVASVTGVQSSAGDGDVTITFIMDDPDDDNTLQAKVEYSLNGGSSWADPTLSVTGSETSATFGDPSINNAVTYQVGQSGAYITSSSGANTVTIVWEAGTDISASTNISNARIRITPYDGTAEGTAGSSANFILDRVAPANLTNFNHGDFSSDRAALTWTAATDTNFNHYEIWSGVDESQVIARSGSAVEWDNDNDATLTTASTATTMINNTDPRNKYFKIFAVDNYGNELTVATVYVSGGQSSAGGGGGGSSSGSNEEGEEEEVTEDEEEVVEGEEEVTEDEEDEEVEEEMEETPGISWEDLDIQPEEGHWSEGYVKYLEEQTNIVEVAVSQPTFLEILLAILETPNEPMPRGNALEFLLVLAGYQLDVMTINVRSLAFEDVSLNDDQAGFIQYAYEQRLVQGYPDGTFQPDRVVNRAEALKLCSYFFEGDWTNPVYGDELLELYELSENPFTDVDLEAWYAPYLINAYVKGVVDGYGDGTFGPGNAVTYAEFLKIATLMQNIEEAVELAEELE